jgi:hypothetical protein
MNENWLENPGECPIIQMVKSQKINNIQSNVYLEVKAEGIKHIEYSFDNGKTWRSNNTAMIPYQSSLTILTRNKLTPYNIETVDVSLEKESQEKTIS